MPNTKKAPDKMTADESLLYDLVAAFTRHPQDIRVEGRQLKPGSTLIELEVNRDDQPRVIGSRGKHIQALRTIFQYIAAREKREIRLILLEPTRGEREEERLEFRPNMDWQPDNTLALIERVLGRVLRKPFQVNAISAGETTNLEVAADKTEKEIIVALKPSLHPIFNAIGKNEGRQLFIELPEPVPAMP